MQAELITNLKNMAYSITIASIITIIIITLSNIYNENSLIALLISYGAIVSSLVLIFGILYNNYLNIDISILYKLKSLFPLIIVIAIILFLMFLLIKYYEEITNNRVSNYYYMFSLLSTIFLVTQLIILYNDLGVDSTKYLSSRTFSILTLLGTINFIIAITLGVILKFYTTDG